MEKAKGTRGQLAGSRVERPPETAATLSELGVSKSQSSRWQALAAVPEPDFEAALGGEEKPTTNGIIAKPPKMPATSLWLWGRLRDFERDGLLAFIRGLLRAPQERDLAAGGAGGVA